MVQKAKSLEEVKVVHENIEEIFKRKKKEEEELAAEKFAVWDRGEEDELPEEEDPVIKDTIRKMKKRGQFFYGRTPEEIDRSWERVGGNYKKCVGMMKGLVDDPEGYCSELFSLASKEVKADKRLREFKGRLKAASLSLGRIHDVERKNVKTGEYPKLIKE